MLIGSSVFAPFALGDGSQVRFARRLRQLLLTLRVMSGRMLRCYVRLFWLKLRVRLMRFDTSWKNDPF